jgi:hypothetical protein
MPRLELGRSASQRKTPVVALAQRDAPMSHERCTSEFPSRILCKAALTVYATALISRAGLVCWLIGFLNRPVIQWLDWPIVAGVEFCKSLKLGIRQMGWGSKQIPGHAFGTRGRSK